MNEREALILGALLHDIGKFWQRTGIRQRHESLGTEFLDLPVIRQKVERVADLRDVRNVISEHHASGAYDVLVRIAQIADRLASGERRPLGEGRTQVPWETPMQSIFAQIYHQEANLLEVHYPTRALALDQQVIFPRASVDLDYEALWRGFLQEAEYLPEEAFPAFFEALLYLLRKYTWCVPSAAYRDHADISLYDHARVTAALAWCLYDLRETLPPIEQYVSGRGGDGNAPVALLVGGDISGIQAFIYSISSEGAAKSLRGRSVFLSLLSDAVAGYAMRQMGGIPPCNLLYSSGGHFYFLASVAQGKTVGEVQEEVARRLFGTFGGDLYCGLAAVPLSARNLQLESGALSDRWGELMERLGQGKGRRFQDLMPEQFEAFFEPQGTGDVDQVCAVCHVEISPETRREVGGQTDEGRPVCSLCQSFEDLGNAIPRSEFLLARPSLAVQRDRSLTWWRALEELGTGYRFSQVIDPDWERAYVLDSTQFLERRARGFRFVGRAAPFGGDGRILSFEELANNAQGVERWGLIRMDVDNLGQVFREGLGGALSISRISTLSSMLSIFFEGYVNILCEQEARGRSYVIYTGGDDSFIVGSWDAMVDLALTLRERFRAYTCHNPKLTLSASVTLEAKKYPLYKAAEQGFEALESAKDLRDSDGKLKKDGITFLGKSMFWADFAQVMAAKDILLKLLEERDNSRGERSLLQKLNAVYVLYEDNKRRLQARSLRREDIERLIQNDRWRWRFSYSIGREAESSKRKEELEKLKKMILEENLIDILNIAVRWAELLTRK